MWIESEVRLRCHHAKIRAHSWPPHHYVVPPVYIEIVTPVIVNVSLYSTYVSDLSLYSLDHCYHHHELY
jgi:hypothetical protein